MFKEIMFKECDVNVIVDGREIATIGGFDDYRDLWLKIAEGITEGAREVRIEVRAAGRVATSIILKVDQEAGRLARAAMRELENLGRYLCLGRPVVAEPDDGSREKM